MQTLKRTLGLLWLVAGPLVFGFLVWTAYKYTRGSAGGDIGNPVPWLIIIAIFAPIALGLSVFGWYCWKGEYEAPKEGE